MIRRWLITAAALLVGLLSGVTLLAGTAQSAPPRAGLCDGLTGDALTRCLYSELDDRLKALEPTATATATATVTATATATETTTAPPSCVKPTVDTTGPTGTRTNSSVTTINADNVTLENVNVASLRINGNNATVRNVQINGELYLRGANALVQRTSAKISTNHSAVGATLDRVRIGGGAADGLHINSGTDGRSANLTIRDSLITEPGTLPAGAHYDGIQVRGIDGLLVECSAIDIGAFRSGYTSAVLLEDANGGNTGIRFNNSWLLGGGYVLYPGTSTVSNFTGNRFGGQYRFGICYPGHPVAMTESGNMLEDGTPLDLAADCR